MERKNDGGNIIPRPLVWCSWCHEPIQFYLRRSAAPASVVGAGRWIPAWYDRIHTKEALKRAADLGVDFIYTHFYKGFGLKFEQEQMKRTAGLAEVARDLGITCVGYCTLPTVYYETIVEELPDIGSCLRRNMDGTMQHYGGSAGYRALVCYNSRRYYEEYYPELIRYGLEEVGLAGFHFDNAGETPCWCETCRRKFREHLARTGKDPALYGLASWNHVELPGETGRELDSVAVEWHRWRRQVCSERHRAVFRLVKERNPRAIVLYNPGLGRFAGGGYEPLDAPKEADMAFLETSRAIRLENGAHITGTAGFKLASLCNIVPLNASWFQGDGVRVHSTWEEISLCCAEQMVFAGNCGAHWLVRPVKKGDRMICDDPEQFLMAERCFSFFRANSALYAGTKQVSQVCVYYSRDSRLLFPDRFREEVQQASELLRGKKITWRFVSENSAPPARGEKLLLAGAYMLSDREVETIRSWRVPVVSLSGAGVLDERGWEREEIPFPAGGTEGLTGMFEMDFPHGVIEIAVSGDALLLHLLNMDNGQTVKLLEVGLPFPAEKAACFSFEPEVRAELKTPRRLVLHDLKTFCTVKLTGNFSAAVSGCGSDKPHMG